ncbi:MAG TPA: MCP four helix bundle domain-containing protein, partial [Rhodocyclaceae bacterium]|nr:MCP four helix bundle domain-containing protein [Rhodocyclaceae bacterium]
MKLTVKQKMALLGGSALLGISLLAGISQSQMEKVFDAANYCTINTVPSLYVLDDLRKNQLRTRIQMNRHILNTDDKVMAEIEDTLNSNRRGVRAAIQKYQKDGCDGGPCVSDDKDREYIKQTEQLWDQFDAKLEPILVESRKGEAGMAKARDMMAKTQDLYDKIGTIINDEFDYNMELGKKGAAEAKTV